MASTVYRRRQEEVEKQAEEARQRAYAGLPRDQQLRMSRQESLGVPQEPQSGGMSINPMQFMNMAEGNGMFGGLFGAAAPEASMGSYGLGQGISVGTAGSAELGVGGLGTSGLMGSGTGGAATGATGASGMGGMGSSLAAAGPWAALAAIIGLQENYQHNIGNREGESFPLEYGLTGRAAYKDKDVWGDKADDIIPGLGSGVRIAGGMSSPVDLFRGETYKDLLKEMKSGGVLGGLLKGLF